MRLKYNNFMYNDSLMDGNLKILEFILVKWEIVEKIQSINFGE